MDYEIIIGLEVHAQLLTKTKLFCSCSTSFGAPPNTNVCPVCLGLPGTLPVINKEAVNMVIKTGLALNCKINNNSIFARKNYYYPDLPKNYQISQYEYPLCTNGYLMINNKKIRIRRIHLEEDAAKLLHLDGKLSAIDYNRCSIPLMEIVSEPDITTPLEAIEYLMRLKTILQYLSVSTAAMEEGALRCEPNISLRKKGDTTKFGEKIELKNLNSFKAVKMALEYEIKRQIEILNNGGKLQQETRRWDDETQKTYLMRTKEEAPDYRYFPDPDLLPLTIDDEVINKIKLTIPELPETKKKRYIEKLHLPEYDAEVITSSKELAEFYEQCLKDYDKPKIVSNWVMNELLKLLNESNISIQECKIKPADLVDLLKLIDNNVISGKIAKEVFKIMFTEGESAQKIIEERGLIQIRDEDKIKKIVDEVIKENPKVVDDYKKGNEKAIMFLVGCVMKKSNGKANPKLVNELLKEKLKGICIINSEKE